MELDDLKNIWQSKPFTPKDEEEIAAMLKGKSNSIIAKLKRNIWFELLLTVAAGCVLVYRIALSHDGHLRWILASFVSLFLLYIIYYIKKINLLSRYEGSHGNIKMNLYHLIQDLTTYIRFYKKSYTFLYPFYFVLILTVVVIDRGMTDFIDSLKHPKTIIILLLTLSFTIVGSLWFTSWYLKKLYGNHLQKLRELLTDIEEPKQEQE